MATMTAVTPPARPALGSLAARRKLTNRIVVGLCLAATLIGLVFLASILVTLFWRGIGALHFSVFLEPTRPTGSNGGLANVMVGSLIQTGLGTLIGTPIGILVGTYLAEYARRTQLGNAVRFVSDILLSAPSILIGLFVYQLMVVPFGTFSGIAGCVALAVIVIPIVVRTTEDMLRLIPDTLREAVIGLGAPKWRMIVFVCYPAVRQGIATGVLLAVARIAGETAPLLFTSLNNYSWSFDLGKPMGSLPVTIYAYAGSPYQDWINLAWAGALVITCTVLMLNILARVALRARR
jgi:phosphate transport system permease protein